MNFSRRDMRSLVPCPACGAWAGEPCRRMYTKDGTPNGVVFTPDHHMARCSLWHAIKFHRGEQSASRTGYVGRRKGMNGGCSAEIDDIIDECHDDKDRSGFDVHRGTPAGVVVSFPTGDVFFSSKMLRGDPWQR